MGQPKPEAAGLYKTWPDPLQGNEGSNIAYGTKQSSGTPQGNNPRIGTFSTLATKSFSGNGRFEYRGRLLRTTADTRIGLTFFSSYPEKDAYYLIGLWTQPSGALTMQLFGFGAGAITGTTDSKFTPEPNRWYRFLIQVDDSGATKIRARFWPDGTPEPSTFSIDAADAAETRLTSGRIGIWSAVRGDAYVDDLSAKSPVDHAAPQITFYENGVQLAPGSLAAINHDAVVDVHATDDLSGVKKLTVTADGNPYQPLTPIVAEGTHTIHARAVDNAGNASESEVQVLVDKTKPIVALTAGGKPLPLPLSAFKTVPSIGIDVTDNLTKPAFTATLDNVLYVPNTPIDREGTHYLSVVATDAVGNETRVDATILVDLGAPTIEFLENGVKLGASAHFNYDPKIDVRLVDAHSKPDYTATLTGGAEWKALQPLPLGRTTITVVASDEAGNTSKQTLDVLVDKDKPQVVLRDSERVLEPAATARYKNDVAVQIEVTDATSPVKWSATLDGAPYTSGESIAAEGLHTLVVHAADEAENVTDVTLHLLVDKSAPVITFYDGATKLDERTLQKFRADASITIKVDDAVSSATYTATLATKLGATRDYASGTPISVEAEHELTVDAIDEAKNTARATLTLLVDKTAPIVALTESGQALSATDETPFGRDAKVDIAVTDNLQGVTFDAKLDGADYASGAPISADGHHVVAVHAADRAGNVTDRQARILIDKTGPTIRFFAAGQELDTTARRDFNTTPSIEIRVEDKLTPVTPVATIDGAPYVSGTPVADGFHTIHVVATDALQNNSERSLQLLVDTQKPVIVLKEGTSVLPPTGAVFARPVHLSADVTDTSKDTEVDTLDGQVVTLPRDLASDGSHTLSVTVTDLLKASSTATSTFLIDQTGPKIFVFEGLDALLDQTPFARDVVLNAKAEDLSAYTLTATIDGAHYDLGTPYAVDGAHTLVVDGVDVLGNKSAPVTRRFYIDRQKPGVRLIERGGETAVTFPEAFTFKRDIIADVAVESATTTTKLAAIDGGEYQLGTPYGVEGHHELQVVVTNIAGLQTTVKIAFTIDKTRPTLTLYAQPDVPFTDGTKFAADITPTVVAADNLAHPPKVVVTLDDKTLPEGSAISAERFHTISATATDDGGNSTTVGPFQFVIDKSKPGVKVTVEGKELQDGDQFRKSITPEFTIDDLTATTLRLTLDRDAYAKQTPIATDGQHVLVVAVQDDLGNETTLEPLHFVIDTTAPVVTIVETTADGEAPFTGGNFKRSVKPEIRIVDTTKTITNATLNGTTPWTSGQEITSDGHYKLDVTVTDELQWSFTHPTIEFTIDTAAPVVTVTEDGKPLVSGTIFNRDARPKIETTDTTRVKLEAFLDEQPYTSETPVTAEARHTLRIKATDELGLVSEPPPIVFTVDKTAPLLAVTENGQPFIGNVLLNHDALPIVTPTDLTAVTYDAKVDGAAYTLGTPITAEGAHTFDLIATDEAQWTTTWPQVHFFIDKTRPVVTVTANGEPLVSGREFGDTVTPKIDVDDRSATTITATLNDAPYTPGTPIAAEGEYVLAISVEDAAKWTTPVPPIAFVVDKSAPVVQLLERNAPFVTGQKFKRDVQPVVKITDLTETTTTATLDGAPWTPGSVIAAEGKHTLAVTVTDHLGHPAVVPPVEFTIDKTPPVVTVTESGAPLVSGSAFNRVVKPQITIADTTATTVTATLNEQPYTFGSEIAAEGKYTLVVSVTDELGWTANPPAIIFFIDKTPPVVTLMEGEKPLTGDLWFNREVTPRAIVNDLTATTATATLNGQPYTLETPVTAEGEYVLAVRVTDAVGLFTDVPPVTFHIDETRPRITITTPMAGATIATAQTLVAGDADDAVSVQVDGVEATIDQTAKTYVTTAPVELLEGDNTIVAFGIDRAGNNTTISAPVRLDTRAPEVQITAPAANACLDATQVQVAGSAADASLVRVQVALAGGTPSDATLSADKRTFTATLQTLDEGAFVIAVTALDAGGHTSTTTIPITIDRTKPVVEVLENGQPFTATLVNRVVALSLRASDGTITATLDGAAYAAGTPIAGEGAHELRATARDCAGHLSDEVVRRFVIDRIAPTIVSTNPASGATVGSKSAISGTLSEPAAVVDEASGIAAQVSGVNFTLAAPLAEGTNALTLRATDVAGNSATFAYTLHVDTVAPSIAITEGGNAIAANAVYRRPVTVVIESDDPSATITATSNGRPFVSGTTLTDDGSYAISARAVDALGHASAEVSAAFRIDHSAPSVVITAPADGAVVQAATIEVRGTVSGTDVSAVTVNGISAALTNNNFAATVPLELGPNVLTAIATDRSGNSASAAVDVVRGSANLALLLTAPVDKMLTNRPTTVVAGQVLSPAAAQSVTVNGTPVAFDPAGAFRRLDLPLQEGENRITATLTPKSGAPTSITVTVTADFTPPQLTVLGNGNALVDGARFTTSPSLTLSASDDHPNGLTTRLTVDGENMPEGGTALTDGGHALTAFARDAFGNETRVDRVFFVGNGTTSGGCALSNFDPAEGASLYAASVRINGRSGGAANVLIDGKPAAVADGSFCGDATLQPGRNQITIRCADLSGQPTSDAPSTLVLYRYVDPVVTIAAPTPRAVVTTPAVTVSGSVGAGVTKGDVNGIEFTVPDDGAESHAFSVPNVSLALGLNVLVVRGRTKSSRVGVATTQVTLLGGAPQLAVTAPLSGSETGATSLDVSGTYANVDPSTIAVVIGSATFPATAHPLSDTTGTFTAIVTLPAATASTLTTTARNAAGAQASVTTEVKQVATLPAIAITAPADNTYLPSTHGGSVHVTGTFSAQDAGGALVQVNGVAATLGAGTFEADVALAPAATAITPIIARVTLPDGRAAADSARVIRFAAPLAVRDTFPTADAAAVDPGVSIVLLFNNPLDAASVAAALRVTDEDGALVEGRHFVDRDAITFAPDQPLRAGRRYSASIATSLRDLSGATLAAAQTISFTAATAAPVDGPLLDDAVTTGCFNAATISGRASTAGARLRLDVDGVTLTTTANASRAFQFTFSFSGQSGYHVVRVRELGADGSLSGERAVCYRITCAVPQVLTASLDRAAKTVTIQFSKPMDPSTLTASPTGSIVITPDGESALAGTVSVTGDTAVVTLANVPAKNIALLVKKSAADTSGAPLASDYNHLFQYSDDPVLEQGKGYVTGAVYDATNGRPLAGAQLEIAGVATKTTDARGRYSHPMREGAYTLQASAPGYTTVWRQVVVPAGAGVVPIDIRLTRRGDESPTAGAPLTLTSGGDTSITRKSELALAAASLPPAHRVRFTAVGGQSLAGLLPLGWSPLAAAEIAVDDVSAPAALPAAKLTFFVDGAAVAAANQTLSLAQYDSERDEWRVIAPVANVASDGRVTFDLTTSGNYALVYPDRAIALAHPPAARAGAALAGVANPCASSPDVCRFTGKSFDLAPKAVLPSGRTAATLTTDGTKPYPSGTAVQAFIDEQLHLADGTTLVDPPFATDLLIYRSLAGSEGVADFHLAPTPQAATAMLRDGVDHIRIVDYPGRIDRGTLLGAEGGRIPGDDSVTIDVPAGATAEPLHAAVTSLSPFDLAALGSVAGFRVAGGFTLSMTPASAVTTADGVAIGATTLLLPARATVSVPAAASDAQVVIAEVLGNTPYGVLLRLAAIAAPSTTAGLFTTRTIVSTQLPLDGIVRDGRYVILVADNPIAFAFGQVKLAGGLAAANARVTSGLGKPMTAPLGVRDLTRVDGLFVVPVAAAPAAPFSLVARGAATGDGEVALAGATPAAGTFVDFGTLALVTQPPHVAVTPADGAELDVAAPLVVQATFDAAIDPASIAGGIRVVNLTTNSDVAGTIALAGASTVRFDAAAPLRAGARYAITVNPSIRTSAGAAFGRTFTSYFTTRAVATNANIRRELISITIPDAAGQSLVTGRPGALPAGSGAVAVRRNRYFVESYGATAASDGSFSFVIGRDPADRVSTSDVIDLQVIHPDSKAIVAVIRLTPFVSADGKSFLAPVDVETKFTAGGIIVTVPANAFETPTMVTIEPSAKSALAGVPDLDTELRFVTGANVTFDGVARKPLELDLPIPPNTPLDGRTFLLGRYGQSTRGPRIEIDDLLTPVNGVFTTRNVSSGNARAPRALTTSTGEQVKDALLRVVRGGRYSVIDLNVPTGSSVGWAAMNGVANQLEVFFSAFHSLYASNFYLTAGHGRIVVPVLTNAAFTVEGVDAATGLTAFTTAYDGLAPSAPGTFTPVASPMPNPTGPYPVFARPMFVANVELLLADEDLTSVPGLTVRLDSSSGKASVTRRAGAPATFRVRNLTQGGLDDGTADTRTVTAALGDRLLILGSGDSVDPTRRIEVVFNEALAVDAAQLAAQIHLQQNHGTEASPDWRAVDALADYALDSGGRRVILTLPSELQRGATYRIVVDGTLRDTGDPSRALVGGTMYLPFTIRKPKGDLLGAPITLERGTVRDLALDGNILYVSAQEGGLLAYDVSDPAAMLTKPPMARAAAFPESGDAPGATWAVFTDRHGRIWTTALTSTFGVIRSYRSEKFIEAAAAPSNGVPLVDPYATAIVSWRPGINAMLPIGTMYTTQSDRAEATPRKLQIASQDEQLALTGGASFDAALTGATPPSNALGAKAARTATIGPFGVYSVTVKESNGYPYRRQRVTIENRTLGLHWSGDINVEDASSIIIPNVLVRAGDEIRFVRNYATYGAVSLFGFGVGLYDLNAIESNHLLEKLPPSTYKQPAEQLALTEARSAENCDDAAAPAGNPCLPQVLTLVADATMVAAQAGEQQVFDVLALEAKKGVLDVNVQPKSGSAESTGSDRPAGSVTYQYGTAFTGQYFCPGGGVCYTDHPRLAAIREKFSAAGRKLNGRFATISRYDVEGTCEAEDGSGIVPCTHAYGLVSANQFGILVLDLDQTLSQASLVDVIWVPSGAVAVRALPGTHYATATDGRGRSLLIDLSHLDERDTVPPLPSCNTAPCIAPLFATATKALAAGAAPDDPLSFGTDDPRIIWKSEIPGGIVGSLAPVADPETGLIFKGDLLQNTLRVLSGIDPHLSVKVNRGNGALENVSSIVPLGIAPPAGVLLCDAATDANCDGSLAAFRIEAALPAGVGAAPLAVETERAVGGATDQTPPLLPRAQLRTTTASGAASARPASLTLAPVLSSEILELAPSLKYQRGANQYVSPWIVAVADPRASIRYDWGSTTAARKADYGCFACARPASLRDKPEPNVFELFTSGRTIRIRPDAAFPAAYDFLRSDHRFEARLTTIPADTVRPTYALEAAQNPPYAGGNTQMSVLLHSGETVESRVDHDAGGRAGWNVIVDRTYRSRTIGGTPLGLGWDSSLFRRLRLLPDGNVEYRDGGGEEWLFTQSGAGYQSPAGLDLRLYRTPDALVLLDVKQRITTFSADDGRLLSESDEFYDGASGGNVIRYLYDGDGRLARIVDPVGRKTTLAYAADGTLDTITDWRGRAVTYHRDGQGRLDRVDLPRSSNIAYGEFDHSSDSSRPRETYGYMPAASDYNSALELSTNLRTITEPGDTTPRVTIDYFDSDTRRDMARAETWGTLDNAGVTYDYTVDGERRRAYAATVKDALLQLRTYDLDTTQPLDYAADRVHIDKITEAAVPVWTGAAFGAIPTAVLPTTTNSTDTDRSVGIGYREDGRVTSVTKPSSRTDFGYRDLPGGGAVLTSRIIAGASASSPDLTQSFGYDGAFLATMSADAESIQTPEARRGKLTVDSVDGNVKSVTSFGADGLLRQWHTEATDPSVTGNGAKETIDYHPADDALLHRRGLPKSVVAGDDLTDTFDYSLGPDTVLRNSPRNVQTRTDVDELGRVVRITVSGPGAISPDESFAYDARGRLVRHKRKQGDKLVEDRYEYDVLGRITRASLYDGTTLVESTQYAFNLPQRTLTTTLPAGGIITTKLDGVGRTIERTTDPRHPFATITADRFRYDIDDNLVFTTDGHDAVATRYDAAHRPLETLRSDATRTTMKIDGWGRLRESKDVATDQSFSAIYTPGGKLQKLATNTLTQDLAWDAAGRTRSVITHRGSDQPVTQSLVEFDRAGRLTESKTGAIENGTLARVYSHSKLFYGGADVPSTVTHAEDNDASTSTWTLDHDALGQTTRAANVQSPGFAYEQPADEAGNVMRSKTPAQRGTFEYKYDARSAVTEEKLPEAAQPNRYEYDANGALARYLDPSDEQTKITNDGLGRPVLRTYQDGSTEEIHYEGDRVSEVRDRQGRRQRFVYNQRGQLEQVVGDSEVIEQLTYDEAGRLIGWRARDTKLEFADFDSENRPQTTRQIRYRADGSTLDAYTQQHTYNGSGQRTSWTMPRSSAMGNGAWTTKVFEEFDAVGNLVAIHRAAPGTASDLLRADFRSAGRPKERRIIVGAGPVELVRQYGYDTNETGIGRLNDLRVFSNGILVAGSHILFEGMQRVARQELGVSGNERYTRWLYDDRGRLTGTLAGTTAANAVPLPGVAGAVNHALTDADFLEDIVRTPPASGESLPSAHLEPAAGGGHKIGKIARGGETETLRYQKADGTDGGSARTEDARWLYEWDEHDQLRSVTQKSLSPGETLRRILYSYNALHRLVGRRVETATSPAGPWQLAPSSAGELPPSITFVWDPLSDRPVAIFDAESGQPLRQFIHGGLGLDDPIEVTVADANAASGVRRYYPILDEAGAGSLQAVVGETGELISRTILSDAYGEQEATLTGPAVDRMTITATNGTVEISLHLTDPLDPTTAPTGATLTTITKSGTPITTAPQPPTTTPTDPYTLTWTLTPSEWQTLLTTPAPTPAPTPGAPTTPTAPYALSISTTPTLRSTPIAATKSGSWLTTRTAPS